MAVPNAARVSNEQGPWRRMSLGSSQSEIELNEKSLYVVDPGTANVTITDLTRIALDGAKVEIKVKDGAGVTGSVIFNQSGNIRVGPGATSVTLTEGDTIAFRYDRDKDAGKWNQIYMNRVTNS